MQIELPQVTQNQLCWRVALNDQGMVHVAREDGRASLVHDSRLCSWTLETRLNALLPSRLRDLLRVALAVYVSDRACRRPTRKDDSVYSRWERLLKVSIPVTDPDFWNQAHVTEALQDILAFYTGDHWKLGFTAGFKKQERYLQGSLFGPDTSPTRAALFSGGLDSVAGLCAEALERPAEEFLLIGAATGPRLRSLQASLASELDRRLHSRAAVLLLDMGFQNRANRAERQDEVSQRSRGFVFSILGAVTAMLAGLDRLAIYENGIGAINLPHTRSQVGVHLTRATNPVALQQLSSALSVITETQFRFELPFLFDTKASVCKRSPRQEFGTLFGNTISCDGFPQRVASHPQCGLCTSCLLRRLSLHAAGLEGYDRQNYRVDVLAPQWDAPAERLLPLSAMHFQVNRLRRALAREDPWDALVEEYPELWGVARASEDILGTAGMPEHRIVAMYRQYCAEWDAFPVQPPMSDRKEHV